MTLRSRAGSLHWGLLDRRNGRFDEESMSLYSGADKGVE